MMPAATGLPVPSQPRFHRADPRFQASRYGQQGPSPVVSGGNFRPLQQGQRGQPPGGTGLPVPGQRGTSTARHASRQPNLRPIKSGRIIARVGSEVIIAGDVVPRVNELIQVGMQKSGGRVPPEEIERARRLLLQRELNKLIDTKLLYADAKRTIPGEAFPQLEQRLGDQFEQVELPGLLEKLGVRNRSELDALYESAGTSLLQQKKAFMDRVLAGQWLRQQVDTQVQVTHDEMLDYYRAHIEDYEFEARARWEEIMVSFHRFENRRQAYAAIARLGNRVIRGEPLAEVARAHSHGLTAAEGGRYDWTSRGSLVSQELNLALFTLPVGQLSRIIESERGFHIIRVLERRDAGRKSFVDAQVEIRKKLEQEKRQQRFDDYLARLRKETRIWTIFDDAESPTDRQADVTGERY